MVGKEYNEADNFQERATIAKNTSLEQRNNFLQNHAPEPFESNENFVGILKELIEKETRVPVTIAVCDIRGSTDLMRHSRSKGTYASIVTSFVEESKEIILSHGGWFDTFTGDGFVCFWIPDAYAEAESLNELVVTDTDEPPQISTQLLPAMREILRLYAGTINPFFKETSKNYPVLTGLSFGLDSAQGVFAPTPTGDRITIIGDPYVGAVRMESTTPPFMTGVNSYPGGFLWQDRDALRREMNMAIQQAVVKTKEFPDVGQEIYLLKDLEIEELLTEESVPIEEARNYFIDQNDLILNENI